MARKKKNVSSGPNNGYLVSFGDTMTALLAFFIVLNSLAEEQSGANLYEGTGSFIRALESFGLPGVFPGERSSQSFQLEQPSPHYLAPSDEPVTELVRNPSGPDDVDYQQRVIDYERESFERFLNEIERLHRTAVEPEVIGEISFDRLKSIPHEPPYLDRGMQQLLIPVAPLVRNPDYAVEVVKWATTPNPTAWTRAAQEAHAVRDEAVRFLNLPAEHAGRFTAVGQPWISGTEQRPVVSIVVRRLRQPPGAK